MISLLGHGYIVNKSNNSIELRFTNKAAVVNILHLINGKFRTPKIDQLHKAIKHVNKKYSLKIPFIQEDLSNLKANAWLSGFIDADGGFYIRYSPSSRLCKFALEQRQIYPVTKKSYEPILKSIASFFNVQLHTRYRVTVDRSYYIIRLENQASIQLLCIYLENYPLLSHKHLDYLNWQKAFNLIVSRQHFSKEYGDLILNYKNQMNAKRTIFSWDHLCRLTP